MRSIIESATQSWKKSPGNQAAASLAPATASASSDQPSVGEFINSSLLPRPEEIPEEIAYTVDEPAAKNRAKRRLGEQLLDVVDLGTVDDNPFFCADPAAVPELEQYMDALRKSGDSIGARVNVQATGVPPGLGEPVFDRLDADIAHAMMGINAVKGVEVGAGFESVAQRGSEHRDEMTPEGFLSNNAGGVLGGISSGQDILVSIALKPTSSLRLPGRSIDVHGEPIEVVTHGRHDPCVGLRATPIAEAMLAIVIMDHWLRHRGQNADVKTNTPRIPSSA